MGIQYSKKPCVTCEKLFQPSSSNTKYCSERCRRGEGICLQCGITFIKKGNTTGTFCSPVCWYSAPGKRTHADKKCQGCQKTFRPYRGDQEYCGTACAHLGRRKPRHFVNCQQCGKELPFRLAKRTIRFCSRHCALLGRSMEGISNKPIGYVSEGRLNGYKLIKVGKYFPGTHPSGWMLEHRYVMGQILGRPLEKHERVHHKNGDRADNRKENLELWKVKKKDPAGVRSSDYHCPGCRCFEGKGQ